MNYIKIYENHTRHAVPVGYEIHHIDHNRENTELKNFLEILDKCNAFVRLRDCLINGENYIGGFESFLKTNKVFEIYNEIYPF